MNADSKHPGRHGARPATRRLALAALATACVALLAPMHAAAADGLDTLTLHAVTRSPGQPQALIRFSAAAPGEVQARVALSGLVEHEQVIGIDYRVAYGVLFALTDAGRLYTLDPASGVATPVGDHAFAVTPAGKVFGFDFNPAADRIRIVSDHRQNLRAHPESGALVDARPDEAGLQTDAPLTYAEGDPHAGSVPQVAAAAYTYNQRDEKLTTNYAIDIATGALIRQGSLEGAEPVVSPNLGLLFTVGSLGVDGLRDAHFDISDVSNTALAALASAAEAGYRLYLIDLDSGRATPIGVIGDGEPLAGLAIEP